MLDRLASTVAMSIGTSNERMTRIEESHSRSEERMTRFEQGLERLEQGQEQLSSEVQALARDMAQMVATRQEDIGRVQRVEEALVKLTDLSEGIAILLAKSDENHPTVLAKLNRIENKVDRLLESQS